MKRLIREWTGSPRGAISSSGREFLFAAAARIVDLKPLVVANLRKVTGVEEGAVVGELRRFVSIAETASGVPD